MIQEITQRKLGRVNALAVGMLLAALIGLMLAASPAHAGQTFEVNNTGDPLEGDPSFGVCNVNFCTLRTAIVAANNHPGPDTIAFNIPNADSRSISPVDELPKITEAVTIDGYSQLFSRPNTQPVGFNGNLKVHLHGSKAGSGANGLRIEASGVTVRGLIIDGFDGSGIVIRGSNNRIEGNFIGTSRFGGSAPTGNGENGVDLDSGRLNTIGGITPAARNVISGNGEDGVSMFGTSQGPAQSLIMGNYIGTDKFGTGDLGNGIAGVDMSDSTGNVVGGRAGNVIAFNKGDGVAVRDLATSLPDTGNSIRSNSMFSNGDLGIDLDNEGVTPNDPKDPDTGPNDLQNKPALTSATTNAADDLTIIRGRLNSTPDKTFRIEFFSNPQGENEGKTLLGEKLVSTNADGVATFAFAPAQAVPAGQNVTATATDQGFNTSEFSAPHVVVAS
jgi:Right handed beta helix region